LALREIATQALHDLPQTPWDTYVRSPSGKKINKACVYHMTGARIPKKPVCTKPPLTYQTRAPS
jgi:hypothetical protein